MKPVASFFAIAAKSPVGRFALVSGILGIAMCVTFMLSTYRSGLKDTVAIAQMQRDLGDLQQSLLELDTGFQKYAHAPDEPQRKQLVTSFAKAKSALDAFETQYESLPAGVDSMPDLRQMKLHFAYITPYITETRDAYRPKVAYNTQDLGRAFERLSAMQKMVLDANDAAFESSTGFLTGGVFVSSRYFEAGGLCLLILAFLLLGRSVYDRLLEEETVGAMSAAKQMRLAMDAAGEAIGVTDKNGNVIYLNPAACRIHGLSERESKEAIGKSWLDLYVADQQVSISTKVLPIVSQKGYWQDEVVLLMRNGDKRIVQASVTKLPGGGLVGVMRDISASKAAEQKLHNVRQQYYQAQKLESLGRLAGGIAHDFNNVLSSISGYTQLLLQDLRRGSEEYGFAQKVYQGTDQAKQLVDRLLTFTRAQNAGTTAVDLVALVHEVTGLVQAGFQSKVSINTDLEMSRCLIQGNPVQLTQVLMNLAVNAYDAMEQGGKLLFHLMMAEAHTLPVPQEAFSEQEPDEDAPPFQSTEALSEWRTRCVIGHVDPRLRYAVLQVEDTGTGIPKAIVEQMFEPFFTTKEIGRGTGLGLATTYGLVLAHKGAIIVDTTVKEGTTFSILLPYIGDNPASIADATAPKKAEQDPTHAALQFLPVDAFDEEEDLRPGEAILVVDDQTEVRGIICTMLQRGGYTVCDAPNGMEAVEMLRENTDTFSLVVTDYSMPGMSGIELAQEVALLSPRIPVILVSGFAEAETQQKIAAIPAIQDFIRKPVQADVLLSKVRTLLDRRKAQG